MLCGTAGAKKCAIESSSLSKLAGFTGVRLGWTVVPKELVFADGSPVAKDWGRIMGTLFNGAANVAQVRLHSPRYSSRSLVCLLAAHGD